VTVRTAVVINPSKVEDLDGRRRAISAQLERAGWPEPLWYETTEDDPGCGQAKSAVEAGARVLFVCGGDGTVMAALDAVVGTDVALCVLPSGTGNLLARNMGLPDDVAAGVRLATEGARRRIDVGVADGRRFAVMAGMGLDGRMIADTDHRTKARFGWPAYAVSLARHLRDEPVDVEVSVDGGDVVRRRVQTVVVGNVGRLQGGIALLPDAEPDDAQLDVALVCARGVRQWVGLVVDVLRNRRRPHRYETLRGRCIDIVSDRPLPREIDGELIEDSCRMRVEVLPSALVLCVSRAGTHGDLERAA
jgi:diacylglycerol kinase family enzyme